MYRYLACRRLRILALLQWADFGAAYARDPTTTYCYTWTTSGRILTQIAVTSGGACP